MVETGLDRLSQDKFKLIENKNLALLVNHASIDSNSTHILKLLKNFPKVKVSALLSAEHGVSGTLQDGEDLKMEKGESITPLYDEKFNFKVDLEIFKIIDTILIDLPDIGTRFYTFSQTVAHIMEASKIHGFKVLILDRPNPISGIRLEGVEIQKGFDSFVGWGPIPQRHGLTIGELAQVFNHGLDFKSKINCDLNVIELKNWERSHYFYQTKLPWQNPSPNIPTLDSAICYAATCMLEATQISEGRGTNAPFQQFGAPDFDFKKFSKAFLQFKNFCGDGYSFKEVSFFPIISKFKNQLCTGAKIEVTNRDSFSPVILGVAILLALSISHPNYFKDILNFPINSLHRLDKFYGSNVLRNCLLDKVSFKEIVAEFNETENRWWKIRKEFLIY